MCTLLVFFTYMYQDAWFRACKIQMFLSSYVLWCHTSIYLTPALVPSEAAMFTPVMRVPAVPMVGEFVR
jgi:hypothetical protein